MLLVTEWLNEFLSKPLGPRQLAEALESAGIEVESISHPPQFDNKIVTATVERVRKHPEADNLHLATVSFGGSTFVVVCGAPNLWKGQRVVLALPGAVLPDGTAIRETKIRGVKSQGMLCSEKELGLGPNHDGILDLGVEINPNLPLYTVYTADHAIIDVKTAANRWDLQSYSGVARETAVHSEAEFIDYKTQKTEVKSNPTARLFNNELPEQVPGYGLAVLKIKNGGGEAPPWMQQRLRLSGIRPINCVVDITNYAMLVTGQPLHAFDRSAIQGIVQIRFARPDESLTTLDGVKRSLSTDDIVIADGKGAIAMAGVIGGETSEISAETTEIALEAATFEAALVRKTAMRHGLRTEASARFERSIPLLAVNQAVQYAASLLIEYADAEVIAYQYERTAWPWVQHIGVRPGKISRLLGLEINSEQLVEALRHLNFDAEIFDIVEQAKRHLDKPYKWGAKYKTDGTEAFDCGYLIDYLYSLIGQMIGHSAPQLMQSGRAIELSDLRPGDTLYRDGTWKKADRSQRDGVSHVALYIGDGKVIHAENYHRVNGEWKKLPKNEQKVRIDPLEIITNDPQFLGARRHIDDLGSYVRVTVPWRRPDVRIEEDIAEEVVKLIGLEEVPSTLPAWQARKTTTDHYWSRANEIRWLLYGLGLYEVTTYPFISYDDIALFRLDSKHLKLANPRSSEQTYLRTTLLPLLAKAAASNAAYNNNLGLFEIARVFIPQNDQQLPHEQTKLGIIRVGSSDTVLELKGYVDELLMHAKVQYAIDQEVSHPALHPARQALVQVDSEVMGWFGEVHPGIAGKFKNAPRIFYAELDIDVLLKHWRQPRLITLPKYPSSFRDITVSVPMAVRWQQLALTLEKIKGVKATFVDEYILQNTKNITIHLEMVAQDKTLTEEDIQDQMREVFRMLAREHGAEG